MCDVVLMEIKVKICTFGKALSIDNIIQSVRYEKGTHNDIGDEPDDYVLITIEDKK